MTAVSEAFSRFNWPMGAGRGGAATCGAVAGGGATCPLTSAVNPSTAAIIFSFILPLKIMDLLAATCTSFQTYSSFRLSYIRRQLCLAESYLPPHPDGSPHRYRRRVWDRASGRPGPGAEPTPPAQPEVELHRPLPARSQLAPSVPPVSVPPACRSNRKRPFRDRNSPVGTDLLYPPRDISSAAPSKG